MKKILFLTGTRADYGKLKPLIAKVRELEGFEAMVAVTGMHCLSEYGSTWREVHSDFPDSFVFYNQNFGDSAATVMSKTVARIEDLLREEKPDLLVVHGDRVETLAAATAGALLNVRVGHVEGGEVSGTVDESLRHAVTKLSHAHFVSNSQAKERLHKLGESAETVFAIGSPELDLASSESLPSLEDVKSYYGIPPEPHVVLAFHPVTTDAEESARQFRFVLDALDHTGTHVIAIEPNNDFGSEMIREEISRVKGNSLFSVFPSIRYERFLVIVKEAQFVIGNSSMGVREAPNYGVPSIDVGSRQMNRAQSSTIVHIEPKSREDVVEAINAVMGIEREPSREFGDGRSAERFGQVVSSEAFWKIPLQKHLSDD